MSDGRPAAVEDTTGPKDDSIGGYWASTVAAVCYLVPVAGPILFFWEDNHHVRHHAVHGTLFWLVAPVVAYASHAGGMAIARAVELQGHWLTDLLAAAGILGLIGGIPLAVVVVGAILTYKARVGDLYTLPGFGRVVRWAL